MNERIDTLYQQFQNFPPKNSIVRNGMRNDAYTIFVFETLFSPYHGIAKMSVENKDQRELLIKSIVAPPDDAIDIFYEVDDLDERSYHIVQVKNSVLRPSEIESCFLSMENSISIYCKNPKTLRKNLKDLISETDFTKEDKGNCYYYLVHSGNTKAIRNQKKNQTILNFSDLKLINAGIANNCVPEASITIDTINNFIINNFIENKDQNPDAFNNKPKSLLCNFNGYDLARLNNEYSSTLAGRNILYGQNLREALGTNSKTYENMYLTINNEPELFLFYNNGITILCSDFNAISADNKENITLKNFSIINGAQTTSTLGAYLKDSLVEEDLSKIEKLKKIYVLTKIYEINNSLKQHEKIGENIRIYTNTQTPLSNRDMVSIRKEQILLQKKFIEDCDYPNAFIAIKNGEKPRSHPPLFPYQIITNERLAQLCFASFLFDPFKAKDKRSKLFNVDMQEGISLNALYHKVFDILDGVLFKINNIQLDELLFIYRLHEDVKRFHKQNLKDQLIHLTQDPIVDEVDKSTRADRINLVKRYQEISAVFIFHNITGYYLLKRQFDHTIEKPGSLIFNSRLYYNSKDFKQEIIEIFFSLIYSRSLLIIAENSGIGNVQNWTRSSIGTDLFIKKLTESITMNAFQINKEYKTFVNKSKTQK